MSNALIESGLFGNLFRDRDVAELFGAGPLLGKMLRFEGAWTNALMTCERVSDADAAAALAALAHFDAGAFVAATDKDGVPVPALIAALREGLAAGPAQAIHTGATSQDVVDTALVLTYLDVLAMLEARLDRVIAALRKLDTVHGARPLMARTRMQAALPAEVSLRVGAWVRLVQAQRDRTHDLRRDLAVVQVGGPIGQRGADGASDDLARLVATELGLRLTDVWHADRSVMVGLGHWLSLVTGALGKIGQDVALMAQQGIDEISLSGGGGSSAMPHKQNPVLAETLVAIARYVAGQQGILAQAMVHEQERSGAAWALEWLTLPAMAEATGAALRHCETLAGQITRIGAAE